MGLFDFLTKKQADSGSVRQLQVDTDSFEGMNSREIDLLNQIREIEKRFNDIDKGIDEITGPDYRIHTITDWLNAIRQASQPWNRSFKPSWVQLFDIFENMVQDTHIQASIDTLAEGIQSKDFYICDESGEKLDDVTKLFKSKWFYDFLEAVLNARLWGFSLIQLDKFDPSNFNIESREVNRKHVRPDLGGVVKQQYDNNAFKFWDKEPFKTWTIFVFENKLGKLNSCARWYIYKTEIARFWAIFNQLYGVPPVIGKTSVKDSKRRKNMISALKNFVSSRFMVTDKDDEIEQFSSSQSGSGQQYFENFMRLCDEQISKALLGSTMVLDNGSSRSQSETHADNTARFVQSICRLAGFIVNKELFPRLRKIGFSIPEEAYFVWDNSEKLTMKERAEVINLANLNYSVPTDTASEFIGIELEEREEEPQLNPIAQGAIDNYKKSIANERID